MNGTILKSSTVTVDLASYVTGNPFSLGVGKSIITPGPAIYGNNTEAWTLVNAGTIIGSSLYDIKFAAAGTISNRPTGTIGSEPSVYIAVDIRGGPGVIHNQGAIIGGDFSTVELYTGGTVTNLGASALISGYDTGILMDGAIGGSVQNSGTISGMLSGVVLNSGGNVSNLAHGLITGAEGVEMRLGHGAVTNVGTISGTGGAAIYLAGGGSVTNRRGGEILGSAVGIQVYGASGSVSNEGMIVSGGYGQAVALFYGGAVTNFRGASIYGHSGILIIGGRGEVNNGGDITGTDLVAINLGSGGSVTNLAGGTIEGDVRVLGASGTVTNAGKIVAAKPGEIGVVLSGGFDDTLINSGTITGYGSGPAAQFGAGDDHLTIDPDAVFVGGVDGGAGANTLELAEGAAAGSLGGLGTQFTNFQSMTVDADASWVIEGANTVASGAVLTDNGTLTIKGTVNGPGSLVFAGGSGTVSGSGRLGVARLSLSDDATLNVDKTLTYAGALSDDAGTSLSMAAGDTLILTGSVTGSGTISIGAGSMLTFSSSVANTQMVAFTATTGTLGLIDPASFSATIAGLRPNDTIDLLKINATGASINANDQLVIVDGTRTVATLTLTGAYSNAMFSVGSDGHGGTDVTMTATEPVTLAEAMQVPPPHVFIAAMAGLASASGGAVHLGTHIDLERPFLLAPRSQLD